MIEILTAQVILRFALTARLFSPHLIRMASRASARRLYSGYNML
jgi:hypothetical protein